MLHAVQSVNVTLSLLEARTGRIGQFRHTLDLKPRFGYKIFFSVRPSFLLLLPLVITFLPPLSFSLLRDDKRTNERVNERTNGNPHLLTSCPSFTYHYKLFASCIVSPSFDTRSATTVTTTIKTTTMLMPSPSLLHVAQKGPFKIFKCEKHGETLEIFFRCTPISV
jgi:hypothetical protein